MDKRHESRRAMAACLTLLLLAAGLVVSACVVQVPVDIQATAQALAHSWATQTAEAEPATTQPAPSPTNTEVPATLAPTDTTTPIQAPTSTSTFTAAPPPTKTATYTATPKPTSTHTVTPKSTVTRTATPSSPPSCPVAVDAALASGWDYAKLGCPKAAATIVWSAWQPFQRGYMIWFEDTDWAYALHYLGGTDSKQGQWVTGGNNWRWDGSFPDGRGLTPPEGLLEPIRGFGFVWYNFLGGPSSQVGWGMTEEKGFCALVQRFSKGLLVQSTAAPGCAGGQFNWAANPDFSPVFIALYDTGSWKRF